MLYLIHAVKWAEEAGKQFKPHLHCNVHFFGSYQSDVSETEPQEAFWILKHAPN